MQAGGSCSQCDVSCATCATSSTSCTACSAGYATVRLCSFQAQTRPLHCLLDLFSLPLLLGIASMLSTFTCSHNLFLMQRDGVCQEVCATSAVQHCSTYSLWSSDDTELVRASSGDLATDCASRKAETASITCNKCTDGFYLVREELCFCSTG